jgi:hypothetical protein
MVLIRISYAPRSSHPTFRPASEVVNELFMKDFQSSDFKFRHGISHLGIRQETDQHLETIQLLNARNLKSIPAYKSCPTLQ